MGSLQLEMQRERILTFKNSFWIISLQRALKI